MVEIKSVIFDFGEVLAVHPIQSDFQSMADVFGISLTQLNEGYWKTRLAYDCATLSSAQYWTAIAELGGKSASQSQIEMAVECDRQAWNRPNTAVVEWADALGQNGLEISLLSNMPYDLMTFIETKCSWRPKFEQTTFSCQLNVAKPDQRIYECAFNKLKTERSNILFVDDRLENIEQARRLGIQAEQYTTYSAFQMQIANRYNLLPPD